MSQSSPVIIADGLRKSFGAITALQGVDLVVEPGTVQALLGRNGAGKSTLVRILSTLLAPDAGRAWICGADVARAPQRVRSLIGLAGQAAAVDETLTGRENLELVGRLYGLRRREARARAAGVLERLSLTAAADRRVFTYSGGMRRRLDLGASLVGHPLVLIMDEPTTGLDPRTRRELWGLVEEFARDGTTVLLTTQYLEEADRLASQIAIIDRGEIVASGTPGELKERLGQDVFEVQAVNSVDVERLRRMLADLGCGDPAVDLRWQKVTVATSDPVTTLLSAGSRIEESGIAVADMGLRRPTLDDVFLTVTAAGSARPVNGVLRSSLPRDQVDHPPSDRMDRRRSARRLVSYLAVAVVAAGLAVGLDSFLHHASKTPRQAAHVSVGAAGHSRRVAAVAGMTQLQTVSLGSTPAGLTPDASGNLWVSLPEAGTVARVATGDGHVQRFHVGGHPTAVGASFDRAWVASSALGPLASLNIHTGAPLNTTAFHTAPTAIALDYDDNSACTIDATGLLTHIDSTGAVLGSAELAHAATGVGCGEGWNWAVEPSPPALVRMGDYGGTRQFNGGPAPVAITFDQGVWIANRNGVVTVFDPVASSLRVARQVTVAPELDGIYANEGDSSVWAISGQTKTLYRISNTAQPAVTGTAVFTTTPVALAVAGGSVWVATQDGNLTQIKY